MNMGRIVKFLLVFGLVFVLVLTFPFDAFNIEPPVDVANADVVNFVVESPHPYSNNYDNEWIISSPGAVSIRVHFTQITTETNYDYVHIYNWMNTKVVTYHGSYGAFWGPWIAGDTVKVRLKTDGSITFWGFKIDQYEYTQCVVESPHPYSNNYDNTWQVSQSGAKWIRVHFSRLEAESGWDYVYIYDGAMNKKATYTGAYYDIWSPWVKDWIVNIRLKTDGSVTQWGFKIDKYEYSKDEDYCRDLAIEWCNDYRRSQDDRTGWSESCTDFSNNLVAKGWIKQFEFSDWSVYESDFSTNDNSWIDNVDIAMFGGHGIDGEWDWGYLKQTTALMFSDWDGITRWHDLVPSEAKNRWGDKDLEWIAFDSCNILKQDADWAATMKGIHLILGYRNLMWLDSLDDGDLWSQYMTSSGPADPALRVMQSWFLMKDVSQANNNPPVLARVIGETTDCGDDYLWGEGPVSQDNPTIDNSFTRWDSPTSPSVKTKTGSLLSNNGLGDAQINQFPPTIMLYRVIPQIVDTSYVQNIAQKIGLSGTTVHYDDGFYHVTNSSRVLIVSEVTGAFCYIDADKVYVPLKYPQKYLPPPESARSIAESYLIARGLMPADASFTEVLNTTQAYVEKETGMVTGSNVLDREVFFGHFLGDYPVAGQAGRIKVFVGDGGEVTGVLYLWREVEPYEPIPIMSEPEALELFNQCGSNILLLSIPHADSIIVHPTETVLGYYEKSICENQTFLIPTYIFTADFIQNNTSTLGYIYVPASPMFIPPVASIDSPPDHSVFDYSETISLTGSVLFGSAPPYKYSWSSDRDGFLGEGSSLSISKLSVSNMTIPTNHTITLTVADSNGLLGYDSIRVSIRPPLPINTTEYYTMAWSGAHETEFHRGDMVYVNCTLTNVGIEPVEALVVLQSLDPSDRPTFLSSLIVTFSINETHVETLGFRVAADAQLGEHSIKIMVWNTWPTNPQWKALATPVTLHFWVI